MKQNHYLLWLFLLFVGMSPPLIAQDQSVSGQVSDENGEPLFGVTVVIKGTTVGTISNVDGQYRLSAPQGGTLVFSFLGYKGVEAVVDGSTINVSMTEDFTNLEEVVVTGLATSAKRANLANSVASISSAKLAGITNQSTMDGALYGKFKGADIRASSGAPGGGISIRLRGVTSLFGDQQPLFIVDGVYVDNSTVTLGTNVVTAAAGGGNTSTNQDDASNRIADLDPEDIENIEILKGAAASAIYGSRAAGGVVLITTKKGKGGETRIGFNQTLGIRSPTQLLGTRGLNTRQAIEAAFPGDGVLFDQNGITDYEKELYDHQRLALTSRLNISGGNGKTSFFMGYTYKDEEGLVDRTGYTKHSVRLNIDHRINDRLKLSVTNNFINSTADRGLFNNGNTNTTIGYALAFTKPWVDLSPNEAGVYPANPAVGSNVLETVALTTNREKINRYIGGGNLDINIITTETNSLKAVISGGIDQYTLRTTGLFPQQLSFYRNPGTLGGVSISGTTVNTNYNLSAFLVHILSLDNGLSFTSQVGATALDFDQNTVISTATGLIGSQSNVDQAANTALFQNREPQKDRGFFFQEEVNFNDQIIGTIGIRGDKSTNNGDANKLYYFPKANLAVNLHNFAFWSFAPISSLKARVAYGEAGRFSNFPDRFTVLNGTVIGGNAGLFTNTLKGNAEVAPERQSELEFGVDIGLLDDRVSLDVTYYRKEVDDQLIQAQVATSSGFTRQVLNAGAFENRGIEIGLTAVPVNTAQVQWTTTVNFWRNESEVTRLDVDPFNVGGFAASLGQYRIQEGKSPTQIVGTYRPECTDCDPDGDGFQVYGDAQSNFDMSFYNVVNYGDFQLSFLLHWKNGGDGVNLSTLLWDLAGLTWDYDDKDLDPSGTLGNGDYRTTEWFAGNAGPWIEDAGYLRLREIGLFYTLPEDLVPGIKKIKVGVSGRNLINIFDYNSYDPEVSNFGNNVLANSIEVTPYPTSKFFNFHLNLDF